MNIQQYINQIKAKKPINFSRFIGLLPELYNKQKHKFFDITLQAPQRWLVTCTTETMQDIETLALRPSSRIQAAEMGDSHQLSVSSGFLLVYHDALSDIRPDVVYLEQDSYLQGFKPKKNLLIVENEENFFLPTIMLKLAEKFTQRQFDLTNMDIVLGSGTRATSALARSWYQQYENIYCAFDYDLAGLKMYRALKTNLTTSVQFLQPHSYGEYEHYFKMDPKKHSKLMECINLAEQLGFTALAETVQKHKKFMEQEMLLLEIGNE